MLTRKILSAVIVLFSISVLLTAVWALFYFADTKVTGQQVSKNWKVWVRTSPCSDNRTEWITVAEKNPTFHGLSYYQTADLISSPLKCRLDAPLGCTFDEATAEAEEVRPSPLFAKYCCPNYSVYRNGKTKETAVVKGSGDPGFGWDFVDGPMCCEEAEEMTGKTGLCGGTTGGHNGQNCFTTDPAMGSTNRKGHYDWSQTQNANQLEANLKSKIDLLYNCTSLSDDGFRNAFADISVIIAKQIPDSNCFGNDRGVINTDRNAHYQWARTKSRQQLYQNLQWKMVAGFRCLDSWGQKTFFADTSVSIAKTAPTLPDKPTPPVSPPERSPSPTPPVNKNPPVAGRWNLVSVKVVPETYKQFGNYNSQSTSARLDLGNGDISDFQWTKPPQQIDENGFTVSLSVQCQSKTRCAQTIGAGADTGGLTSDTPRNESGAEAKGENGSSGSGQKTVTFKPQANWDEIVFVIGLNWGSVHFYYKYQRAN